MPEHASTSVHSYNADCFMSVALINSCEEMYRSLGSDRRIGIHTE